MLAVLRSQKQAADAEQQEIMASQKVLADGSVRPSGVVIDARGAAQSNANAQGKGKASTPPVNPTVAPSCSPSLVTVNGQAVPPCSP